ncbi:MAG TPA: FkbM family methyltransferase [Alphaproteobacteria bacterium]|nr:FkbM family methyltransferase [Alphaproteobacteria bacterium]
MPTALGEAAPPARPADRSQGGESSYLAALISPDAPPLIVDVGAHDGISWSNSAYFIEDGWTALMIEPMPKAFAEMQARYTGNPRVVCRNLACADKAGILPFVLGDDHLAMLSALAAPDSKADGLSILVKVDTLTRILERESWPRDFAILSVDAETMDYEVLLGLDFARFRPRFIVVEDYGPKRPFLDHLLLSEGYRRLAQLGDNHIWKHREAPMRCPPGGSKAE